MISWIFFFSFRSANPKCSAYSFYSILEYYSLMMAYPFAQWLRFHRSRFHKKDKHIQWKSIYLKLWDKAAQSFKLKNMFSSLIHSVSYPIRTTNHQVLLMFFLCHVTYLHRFFTSLQPLPLTKTSISCLIGLLQWLPSLIHLYAFIKYFYTPESIYSSVAKSSVTPYCLTHRW